MITLLVTSKYSNQNPPNPSMISSASPPLLPLLNHNQLEISLMVQLSNPSQHSNLQPSSNPNPKQISLSLFLTWIVSTLRLLKLTWWIHNRPRCSRCTCSKWWWISMLHLWIHNSSSNRWWAWTTQCINNRTMEQAWVVTDKKTHSSQCSNLNTNNNNTISNNHINNNRHIRPVYLNNTMWADLEKPTLRP